MRVSRPVRVWKKAPFLRLLPPLVAGIAWSHLTNPGLFWYVFLMVVILLLATLYELLNAADRFMIRTFTGVSLLAMIFLAGVVLHQLSLVQNDKSWYGHKVADAVAAEITLQSRPQISLKTVRYTARVNRLITKDNVMAVSGSAVFYFPRDEKSAHLSAGDVLLVKNKLRVLRNAGNPGEFDFERSMAIRNIFHRAFVTDGEWLFLERSRQTVIERAISTSLNYFHSMFRQFLKGHDETALAKALLTGDRSDLEKSLVQAYADTGVVHIMAISGLHVGLIYIFLLRLFSVIPAINRHEVIKMVLIICGIWFFAIMTGASPSVLRAAVMFTFLSAGIIQKTKVSTYNFWAAAAFILLCLQPGLLFSVGFQLSFLAVLGILVVQKPIYRWFYFRNGLMDRIWQIMSVTIAAQLFTLPLCLYYFHQLPLLFLLTNLVAIPLASAGLWMSVILMLAGWLPGIPLLAGMIVSWIFRLLNNYIRYMGSLEFSVWKGFHFNLTETIVLSLIIIFLLFWLMHSSKLFLRLAIAGTFVLAAITAIDVVQVNRQRRIVIYNIPSTTAVDFIFARQSAGFIFPAPPDPARTRSVITATRNYFEAADPGPVVQRIEFGENEFFVGRQTLLHIRREDQLPSAANKLAVDIILISGSPSVSIVELAALFDARLYVFSPFNKRGQIEKWKKECEELLLHSHDIAAAGALVLSL